MNDRDKGKWIEKAIVYVGLGMAFFKTSEAMISYAPRGVFGFSADWISYLWAYLGGFMVEGVLYVAYSKLRTRGKDDRAKWAAGIVAVISITFSLVMNRIDQSITDGTLATIAGTSPLALLHNVVFAIPLVGAVLFMAMDVIDNLRDDAPAPDRGAVNRAPVARWQEQSRPAENTRPAPDPVVRTLGLPTPQEARQNGGRDFTERASGPSNNRQAYSLESPEPILVANRHGH